jgi:IS66 C-terminal element
VETCKLNGVDPQAYLCELLTWLVGDWPQARIDGLFLARGRFKEQLIIKLPGSEPRSTAYAQSHNYDASQTAIQTVRVP